MWLMDLKNFPTTHFYLSKGSETLDSSWIYEFHNILGRKTNKPIQVFFLCVCVFFSRYLPSNSSVVENLGSCTLFKLVHENLVFNVIFLLHTFILSIDFEPLTYNSDKNSYSKKITKSINSSIGSPFDSLIHYLEKVKIELSDMQMYFFLIRFEFHRFVLN